MRTLKEVTVEVTQKCYSNCIFCSSFSRNLAHNEIPLKKIIDIFKFVKKKGANNINLSGGEPLLRKDIVEIIKILSEMDLKATIYSSGNVIDSKIIEKIMKKDIPADKMIFIFNYPSCNNETYQLLINSKEMNISMLDNSIKMIIEQGFPVEAHIVPNAMNIRDLFDSILHLKNLSIKQVSLLRIVYQGRAHVNKGRLYITAEQMEDLKKIIKKVQAKLCDTTFSLRVGIPFSSLVCQKCECLAGSAKLIFRYDGMVFPCEAFKEAPHNENYILGNIYTDSFEHIWNNHPVYHKLNLLKKAAVNILEDCPAQLLYK